MNQRRLFSAGSLVLLGLLFIALVILSGLLFKGWRLDLTENRQYTLSEGTQAVLASMQEPVTFYYFFSEEASAELPQVRSHARWVGEMLDDMAERSGGKLTIRRIDPTPFSPEEDEAAGFGLQAVPVGTVGDPLYFGIAASNSLDDVQTIPFLNPSKQAFFEYDVAKLVSTLSHPDPLRGGLLSSLDMGPGFDMNTQQPRPAWGVDFDPLQVMGDALYALQVNTQASARPVRHLAILSVAGDGLNGDDIVSGDLEVVNVSSSGWLAPTDDAATAFTPLLTTSENAAPIEASRLRFLANPADLQAGFQPTGDRYALAARVQGPAGSAFDAPPDGFDPGAHRSEAAGEGINLILFADTDLLTDRLWVSQQSFFGQVVSNAFADNGTLVVNAVDNLLGTDDLISIRARATSARPFDRVESLRLEAESQYRATEERLNQELAETERTLAEMQAARGGDGDLGILNAEQADEIQRFLDRRTEIRRELRAVQHELGKDIAALGTRLTVLNVVAAPLVVILVALWVAHRRRHRREASA